MSEQFQLGRPVLLEIGMIILMIGQQVRLQLVGSHRLENLIPMGRFKPV